MDRPLVEAGERGFDFAKALIDLVRQLVGVLIFGLQLGALGVERLDGRLFVSRQVERRAHDLAQAVGGAIGEAHRHLDPFPAFAGDRFGGGFQLVGDQAIEQRRILQPAAVVILEEIAQHAAAVGFIGIDADEYGPLVGCADGGLGQHAPDLVGFPLPAIANRLPDLLLTRMIVGDGEGHELFERDAVLGIDIEQ